MLRHGILQIQSRNKYLAIRSLVILKCGDSAEALSEVVVPCGEWRLSGLFMATNSVPDLSCYGLPNRSKEHD